METDSAKLETIPEETDPPADPPAADPPAADPPPKIEVKLAKNPKRVAQGKRLSAISRTAKERKRAVMEDNAAHEVTPILKWFLLGGTLLLSTRDYFILRPVTTKVQPKQSSETSKSEAQRRTFATLD